MQVINNTEQQLKYNLSIYSASCHCIASEVELLLWILPTSAQLL